jgi:chaperone BCS1
MNSSTTTDLTHAPQLVLPAYIASLVSLIAGSSDLLNWLKLIVVGAVLETLRRLVSSISTKIINSFFITATFDEYDDSYCKSIHTALSSLV